MPICRKCNKDFPRTIKVDNKRKTLCNRVFCLECSPYKKHNTSKYLNNKIYDGVVGSKEYNASKYLKNKERLNKQTIKYQQKKRIERKQELVNKLGGKCVICGYNRCNKALEFHHRDPTQKEIGISNNITNGKWTKILEEIEKCILLCSNCHREVHEKIIVIPPE